jgi:hypothetical protein
MGDGNHSFATAKAIWEEKKKNFSEEEKKDHPARFAIVEINNVHDDGINFEPIHRVLFNLNTDDIMNKMAKYFESIGSELIIKRFLNKEELKENLQKSNSNIHYCRGMDQNNYFIL